MTEEEHQSSVSTIPLHWHEGTVVANGIRQHYYRTEGEHDPLILLHGFTENGLCWSRVAEALERDSDVIMLDARGHGLSGGPETGYSQDLLTQDVIELIHTLKLRKPALFGHSNGALTAASVAATAPELVRAIILEDPPWGEAPAHFPSTTGGEELWPGFKAWYKSWIAWHKALRRQTPAERIASSRQFLPPRTGNWDKEELLSYLEGQAQFNLDVLNFTPMVPTRTPWRETVERIACPILLLTGDTQRGVMIAPEQAQEIAAAWHKGQVASFAGVGHFMHREMQGEQFAGLINVVASFLKEV